MTVISNSNLGDLNTSSLGCVWFFKLSNPEVNYEYIVENLPNINNYIKYYIDWTNPTTYPKLLGLMEYNKVPNIDYPEFNNTGIEHFNLQKHYIGEYYSSDTIIVSKIIFPKKLIKEGYNAAVLFQHDPEDFELEVPWKYLVIVDLQNSIDNLTDNIIQFTNDANDKDELFTDIHKSNYSNPHTDQISRISTTTETSNITSFNRFNDLVTNMNSIVIGNQLVSEDYSVRYLGNYLYVNDYNNIWGDLG